MALNQVSVVQVVSGLEIAHGGPTYSVPMLHSHLERIGVESRIYADNAKGTPAVEPNEAIRIFPRQYSRLPVLEKLHLSSELHRALGEAAQAGSILHGHGLWRMPNIYAAWATAAARRPLVVSPRGMMAPAALEISRLHKRLFSMALQDRALAATSCFHATSVAEMEEIRAYGLPQPVAVIPNGIHIPDEPVAPKAGVSRQRYVLYLGRLHPKKALDRLIGAWALVASEFPEYVLKIVGPAEDRYDDILRETAARLGLSSVEISDAVYGADKEELLFGADLFAISSLNENFGNSVSESLAHGVPVITTKGTPWAGGVAESCGWWVDHGVEPMAAALREALSLPRHVRRSMGRKGRAWMSRSYGWERVAWNMRQVYVWLAGEGERPSCVSL